MTDLFLFFLFAGPTQKLALQTAGKAWQTGDISKLLPQGQMLEVAASVIPAGTEMPFTLHQVLWTLGSPVSRCQPLP